MSPFVVVGESLVDIVVPADGSAAAQRGRRVRASTSRSGSPGSTSPTTLVTRIGDDELGGLVRRPRPGQRRHAVPGLRRRRAARRAPRPPTSTSTAPRRTTSTWCGTCPRRRCPRTRSACTSAPWAPSLSPGRASVVGPRAARRRRRPVRQLRPEHPAGVPRRRRGRLGGRARDRRRARLVKLSDEDLRLLRPGAGRGGRVPRPAGRQRHRAGRADPRRRRGATAFTEGATLPVPAPPTDLVDTVGAGDSFMAAMLAMLCDWGVVADGRRRAGGARRRPGAAAGAGRGDRGRDHLLAAGG